MHTRLNAFQTQVVIHRMSQFLFAPQVVLGGLNGRMAKQELNLFKFSPSQVA
jgi:di/tricarboxylate transporter